MLSFWEQVVYDRLSNEPLDVDLLNQHFNTQHQLDTTFLKNVLDSLESKGYITLEHSLMTRREAEDKWRNLGYALTMEDYREGQRLSTAKRADVSPNP